MRRHLLLLALSLALLAGLVPATAGAAGAGSTVLVSRPDGFGSLPDAFDNFSSGAAVSANGRYVVFGSSADGFAPGVDPTVFNLFLRDTRTSTTTLVSRSDGLDGAGVNVQARDPDIAVTNDGRVLVAFVTRATNLVDHATGPVVPGPVDQVWVRDVMAGTTSLVSRTGRDGAPADADAEDPAIAVTAGGPVVAFSSRAGNLGAPGRQGVFLRTIDAATTALVSCGNRNCAAPNRRQDSDNPDIVVVPAAAGTACTPAQHPTGACVLVAFDTIDETIHLGTNIFRQVVVAAATTPAAPGAPTALANEFTVASKNGATFANGFAQFASFSSDGRAVAFQTIANNLTADTVPDKITQAYVRRLDTGTVELVTRAAAAADSDPRDFALGGDVAHLRFLFSTFAGNLGGPGTSFETYVRDLATSTTSVLDRDPGPAGAPRGFGASLPAISADGSAAVYSTSRTDLVPGEPFGRVRLRRLNSPGQEVELISRPSGDEPTAAGTEASEIRGKAVSADGRYVAFGSETDGLSADDDDRFGGVFVRDLLTGRTALVSRASGENGVAADADASVAGISADGRRVVFSSPAGNLSPDATAGIAQAYVRDLDANTTTLASRTTDGRPSTVAASASGISADGNAVLVTTTGTLDPAIGADGQPHIYVRDLRAATTTLADRDSGVAGTVPNAFASGGVIDADGDHVAWSTSAPLAGAPADGKRHVFVRDLRTHETTLVSRADGPDGASAKDDSFSPAISANGDIVAFASRGQNLGVTFPATQVFVRDVAAARTEIVSRRDGALPANAFSPAIDAAGERVVYSAEEAGKPQRQAVQLFVLDRPAGTTDLVSRADGADGAPGEGSLNGSSISANGNCVAFGGTYTNLNDGFASADFVSVHLRVVRGECPIPPPARPADPPASGAGSPPTGGQGGSEAGDPKHPTLFRLALSPSHFHVGGRGGGTTIRFTLTNPARVTLRFDRLITGHRKGRACSTKARTGKRCTIVRRAGTLTLNGRAGANRRSFSGKLKGKALPLGRYRVTASVASGRGDSARVVVERDRVRRR